MLNTKKDVKQFEMNLGNIQLAIRRFSEDYFNQKIVDTWNDLKIHEAEKKLKHMPIDTLSVLEKGLPIYALLNNGYKTIYDIKHLEVDHLLKINGIGQMSAQPIYDSVSKIKTSVYQQTNPRINPDQPYSFTSMHL